MMKALYLYLVSPFEDIKNEDSGHFQLFQHKASPSKKNLLERTAPVRQKLLTFYIQPTPIQKKRPLPSILVPIVTSAAG